MASGRLPDLRITVGSVFTPIRNINSMKPNTDKVSRVVLPLDGNTFSAKVMLYPRTDGPRITPP